MFSLPILLCKFLCQQRPQALLNPYIHEGREVYVECAIKHGGDLHVDMASAFFLGGHPKSSDGIMTIYGKIYYGATMASSILLKALCVNSKLKYSLYFRLARPLKSLFITFFISALFFTIFISFLRKFMTHRPLGTKLKFIIYLL